MASSAPVVDRSGPPQRPRDLRACEVDAAEAALLDGVVEDGLAVALGRAREAAEVAAAPGIAVAELEVRARDAPVRHTASISHWTRRDPGATIDGCGSLPSSGSSWSPACLPPGQAPRARK